MPARLKPHTPVRPGDREEPPPFFSPFGARRPSQRSVVIGVVGTVLFHLLFIFGIPRSVLTLNLEEMERPNEPIDIELVEEPEEPEPDFVETNQEAPDNVPDDTDNFSARNQQAANEEVPDELSPDRTPATEGEDRPEAKIISGDLNPPVTSIPAQETPASPEIISPSTPRRQDPLPGFEEDQTESEEGTGSSIADASPDPTPGVEEIEGEEEKETNDQTPPIFTAPVVPNRASPAPRPRLPRATPGPVRVQPAGVSQTGRIAVNANFSQFGEYLERMIEAVSQRWNAMVAARSYGESTVRVVLEFQITRDGAIEDMVIVDSSAQALGILLCRTAVQQGQPYGVWPKEMVDVLGDSQTITFAFYYW